ncbi:3-dehydroquinate synthase [Listeria weihenstephanensis FSL R9-0317]|uniref:3-dehydroquinate synthase n=1 Tax=Listeria weihenstephanensis TaxID=1006155 RepID=A0A1S7FTM0_9LIST|nr:3-dehydroquinate synthase [Listeria weihenstephanensis]AQY50784.1 3-dehydroquinate synthase [Listeria weihenstephanensis]EUJ38415.1 3-dehydroquinate synthase [Listeria weihenstephanensis FSL R9-0317]MBC1499463.1 3-dehydroquinate synthase [Listeria weihenstephanensis]
MPEITVTTTDKVYPVYISQNALNEKADAFIAELARFSKIFVMTDANVAEAHLEKLDTLLAPLENVFYYITPAGEGAKTFAVYEDALTKAIEVGLDRKSVLLAFGGGVIGDLGGFVASTYMRGIAFYQIPTTVLAHDSAVGGKVAINHPLGKNMVGNFYQPEAVIYDTSLLGTLSEREMRSGFAELVKHALIRDPALLVELMETYKVPMDLYRVDLTPYLTRGIEIKAEIVSQDETEQGIRAYLNFGHTFGHAVEAYGEFGKWLHGESIMFGMIYALDMSEQLLGLSFDKEALLKWLAGLGYDVRLPVNLDFAVLLESMKHDKKTTFNEITMVLLEAIGKPTIQKVSDEVIATTFERLSQEDLG